MATHTTKALEILVKASKYRAEELQQRLSKKAVTIAMLDSEKNAAQEKLSYEKEFDGDIAAFITFQSYSNTMTLKIKEIDKNLALEKKDITTLQEELYSVYTQLKTYEILLNDKEKLLKKEALKKENQIIDELGLQSSAFKKAKL